MLVETRNAKVCSLYIGLYSLLSLFLLFLFALLQLFSEQRTFLSDYLRACALSNNL